MQNAKIIQLILKSNKLPKIPPSFGNILQLLLSPDSFDMDECITELSKYPRLEHALIDVLNCTSKLNKNIVSLKDAVLYLGAKNTKFIVISYITRLLLPNAKGCAKLFDNKVYWKHCLGTSIAAFLLAQETGLSDKDKLFTYGLIHDIGLTVIDICLPDHLDKIHSLQQKGLHQIAAEKIVLGGKTHADIGMWLCHYWGLPEEIEEVVGHHHSPFLAKSHILEVQLMHLADSISTNYYGKLMGNPTTFIYSQKVMDHLDLSKSLIDEIILKLPKEVDRVSRHISF